MNANRPLMLALLLASLPLVACGASPDATTDTQTSHRATSTGPSPTTTSTAHDDPPPGSGACAATVADYCASATCYSGWTTADEACMESTGALSYSTSCGAYFALATSGGTTSYFDSSSQALVAVVDASGDCVGGPSDFVAPASSACFLVPCGVESCGGPPDGGMP